MFLGMKAQAGNWKCHNNMPASQFLQESHVRTWAIPGYSPIIAADSLGNGRPGFLPLHTRNTPQEYARGSDAYPSASSTAVYDFHVSVLKRHAESLQRLTVDVVNDDLRKIWEFTPKMISYILRKMMRLTEVSLPLHPNGWDILHRDIRASNLRRLAITIDLGSKGPYQMAEEVKTAITGSAAPLQVITIARRKSEILEGVLPDDDIFSGHMFYI